MKQTFRKKKILVDLDVVTVALWNKKDIRTTYAKKFIKRIEDKEFYVVTPSLLVSRFLEWKNEILKNEMEKFYLKLTNEFITNEELDNKIDSLSVDDKKVLLELEKKDIKDEDALLTLITSIFNLDYLVTFNRIHLRNKKQIINEVLKKNGLKTIKIVGPEEI